MNGKYEPLEQYLRGLPTGQDEVTLSFEFIEQVIHDSLPEAARQEHIWWGNQKPGTLVESIPWMDAGWLVDIVDLRSSWVRFVRQ